MAVSLARDVAAGLGDDSLVVTLLPDSGERYLSKFKPEWLESHGLA
jgi:cysteine synthase